MSFKRYLLHLTTKPLDKKASDLYMTGSSSDLVESMVLNHPLLAPQQ